MKKVELEIITITHSVSHSHSFAVILGEKFGKRRLPIVIGNTEAQAIAIALENIQPTRPLTHDLMRDMLIALDVQVNEVVIHNLVDGIFYSTIMCSKQSETFEFDSRTSDAIALSTRFKCPIFTYDFILDAAGVSLEEGEEETSAAASPAASRPPAATPAPQSSGSDYATLGLADLEALLQKALDGEDYEKAARIRDEIQNRK
jgi:hypothetical protein